MKNIIGRYLTKLTIGVAMAATFVVARDIPCFFALGEPEVPNVLLELKKNKLGE